MLSIDMGGLPLSTLMANISYQQDRHPYMLSAKQDGHWDHFYDLWYDAARDRKHDTLLPKNTEYVQEYKFYL